jgi:hypothetical protein
MAGYNRSKAGLRVGSMPAINARAKSMRKSMDNWTRKVAVVFVLCAVPSVLEAQLYLISGSPNYFEEKHTAILLQPGDGGLHKSELVSAKVGIGWVGVSYDWRKVILITSFPNDQVLVLDLDQAAIVKTCALPDTQVSDLVAQWLADAPGRGPSLDWWIAGEDGFHVQSMALDPSVSCDNSVVRTTDSEEKYVVAEGTSGLAGTGSVEGFYLRIGARGQLRRGPPERQDEVTFDYEIPVKLREGLPEVDPLAKLIVNEDRVMVVGVTDRAARIGARILAFRKSDKTWHVVPIRADDFELRGFGNFVVAAEAQMKEAISKQLQQHSGYTEVNQAVRENERSAGGTEWRAEKSSTGPSMTEAFESAPVVYPGRLAVYNIDTEKLFTITTNQGDSEILLIEDNTVYYRVSDRLYKAPITDSGIGAASLIATDEAIRDVHWAFMKH